MPSVRVVRVPVLCLTESSPNTTGQTHIHIHTYLYSPLTFGPEHILHANTPLVSGFSNVHCGHCHCPPAPAGPTGSAGPVGVVVDGEDAIDVPTVVCIYGVYGVL